LEEARRVVEALMKVGPRFSDISRATGIPVSTVRYILLKRLPKLGLSVRASINYGALGLQRYLVEFRSDHPPQYLSGILDLMGEYAYLDYYTYSMIEKKFLTIFSIPPKYENSLLDFIQLLKLTGLIKDIKVSKLTYMRVLPFMTECFDFSKGVWLQDWMHMPRDREITEMPEYPDPNPEIDEIDLAILAELQKRVIPVKYNQFAKKLNVSRQTISKHFRHALRFVNLFSVIWFPFMYPELVVSPLLIRTAYEDEMRKVIINIPFTYAEMKSEEDYFAFLWAPSIGLYTSIKFLTISVKVKEWHFQDLEYSGKFSIQFKLYKNGSWINPFEEITQRFLEILQKQKKDVGRFSKGFGFI